jgi:hypothetical protein
MLLPTQPLTRLLETRLERPFDYLALTFQEVCGNGGCSPLPFAHLGQRCLPGGRGCGYCCDLFRKGETILELGIGLRDGSTKSLANLDT